MCAHPLVQMHLLFFFFLPRTRGEMSRRSPLLQSVTPFELDKQFNALLFFDINKNIIQISWKERVPDKAAQR